jgi:hypothetical protein
MFSYSHYFLAGPDLSALENNENLHVSSKKNKQFNLFAGFAGQMTHFPSFDVFRSFLANFDDLVEVLLFKSILRYTITHEIHPNARKHEFMGPKCHFRPQKQQKYRFSENPDFQNMTIFWPVIPLPAPKFDFLKILVNSLGDYLLPEPFLIIFRYSKLLKLYFSKNVSYDTFLLAKGGWSRKG